jgi:hypothetical protein
MVGSSIVKNAFIVARQQPGGINLGLSIINVEIWWQGIRGLVIEQIMKQIVTMLQYEDPIYTSSFDFWITYIATLMML